MQRPNYLIGEHFHHKCNSNLIIRILSPEANSKLFVCHAWVDMKYVGPIRITKNELDESYAEEREITPDVL